MLVQFLFVEQAAFAVECHDLGTETVRRNLFLVVLGDVITDRPDALRRLHEDRHLGGCPAEFVSIFVRQTIG